MTEEISIMSGFSCPVSSEETERVLLGHGAGGHLSTRLQREVIGPALGAGAPGPIIDDAAVVDCSGSGLVFSTDAFVVQPRWFPGGNIGDLAVYGTINDIAMMGGNPIMLSLAYIVEEGLPLDELRRVTSAVGAAASSAGVPIVTGDTKVVGRGAADGLFVVTSGVGLARAVRPSVSQACPGDVIVLSAPIADHGMAVMSIREDLGFQSEIISDTRPLHGLVDNLLTEVPETHVLRDPTRGGLASTLSEIAHASSVGIEFDESKVPVRDVVRGACELLGLDPLHVANEGVCVAVLPAEREDVAVAAMRARPEGAMAIAIGRVVAEHPGIVVARTLIGSSRIVDPLIGEQLPRIC